RPWYTVVPRDGLPIAVIPEIGEPGMRATWIRDIRTWPAPDPEDDGVSLLASTLQEVVGTGARVGAELGREYHLRMPIADLQEVARRAGVEMADGTGVIRSCRHVKSELEIDKVRQACRIASQAYAALPGLFSPSDTERSLVQKLRADLIRRGADTSPYLIGVAGQGGYDNIIMGPTDRQLQDGDVLTIDTGTLWDAYFCDFNRNWAVGHADDAVQRAYRNVWQATEAGLRAARPGVRARDVWLAMAQTMGADSLGNVGRLGHGLGLQLTEPPSNHPGDETVLEAGTVLTLEPGYEFAPGHLMVHEEDIVIREEGAELLTERAPAELPILS
ncbi:MAG TPA: Xaa-Pro peptidase family protein, partial [Candidatus Dormibacteraeota bacterium]|nr:Xaa-Pro peptidase family protein [Candidatus Dormibacteraeota bacterium]